MSVPISKPPASRLGLEVHNKGCSRSKHDVFTDISDGVFLHCVTESRTALVSKAIRMDKKRLFTFTAEKPSATAVCSPPPGSRPAWRSTASRRSHQRWRNHRPQTGLSIMGQ